VVESLTERPEWLSEHRQSLTEHREQLTEQQLWVGERRERMQNALTNPEVWASEPGGAVTCVL
jgi:hypothetical protein